MRKVILAICIAFAANSFAQHQYGLVDFTNKFAKIYKDNEASLQFFLSSDVRLAHIQMDTVYALTKKGYSVTTVTDKSDFIDIEQGQKGKFDSYQEGILLVKFEKKGRTVVLGFRPNGTGQDNAWQLITGSAVSGETGAMADDSKPSVDGVEIDGNVYKITSGASARIRIKTSLVQKSESQSRHAKGVKVKNKTKIIVEKR